MEYPDLVEVEGRSKRYWSLDGIPEIVMGAIWVVLGFAFLVRDLILPGSRLEGVYSMVMPMAVLVIFLMANWVMKMLKEKYTFPRGGYVKFQDPSRLRQILTMAAGGLVAAAFIVVVAISVRHRAIAAVSAPAIGVLMAGGFLVASRRPGMRHWVWFSLFALVLGAALYPLHLGWMVLSWFFVLIGVPMFVSGICRLRAFVRSVPLTGGNEL